MCQRTGTAVTASRRCRHRMRPRGERPMRVPPFSNARRRSHLRPRSVASEAREATRPTPRGPSCRRRPRYLSLDRYRLNQTIRWHLERCEAGTQARVLRSRAGASSLTRLASPADSGSEILEATAGGGAFHSLDAYIYCASGIHAGRRTNACRGRTRQLMPHPDECIGD